MNQARYILYAFVLLIAVLLYFQSVNPNSRIEYQKEIKLEKMYGAISMDITGDVTKRKSSSNELISVVESEKIVSGETMYTANDSSFFLFFPSETNLKVLPNTELTIRRMSYENEGIIDELFLKRGAIIVKSSKRKGNDHFTILTPSLVIGVRGLEARIFVNPIPSGKEISKVISMEGNTFVTQHNNGIPMTSEPICNLFKDEMAVEEGFGGNMDKLNFSSNEYGQESMNVYNYTELDLVRFYKRSEIEKIVMQDGTIFRGVLTGMNDDSLFVHTLSSQKKIKKTDVKHLDSEKLKTP
jgi:hypothetical protein